MRKDTLHSSLILFIVLSRVLRVLYLLSPCSELLLSSLTPSHLFFSILIRTWMYPVGLFTHLPVVCPPVL